MPRVPITRSTSPLRPASATVPRPPGPTVPVACASSTISRQRCRWARPSRPSSGARSPSIEKRPSVTISDALSPADPQPPGQVLEVAVAVDEGLGPRQPAAVDDAGVVQLVAEDDLVLAGEGRDHAGVGQVPGAEQERRLIALELGQAFLERPVRSHPARDQARGPGPGAPPDRRLGGGFAHPRVAGEPQVVVRAEEEDRAAVEQHLGALRAFDHSQPPVEPRPAELVQPLGDIGHAADCFG